MRLVRRVICGAILAAVVLFTSTQVAHAEKDCGELGDCNVTDLIGGGGGGGNQVIPPVNGVGVPGGYPCEVPGEDGGPPQPGLCQGNDPAVQVSPQQMARLLVARVQLKPITVGITPLAKGPNSMGLVGLPVWLWADDPSATTWGPVTITAGGMSLTARVSSVSWDMGDGAKFSCGKGTEWKRGMVKADGSAYPSPTCGHTYSKQGTYTITATSHWVAHWSGYGESGDIPVPLSTSYRYVVAELQAIRVR